MGVGREARAILHASIWTGSSTIASAICRRMTAAASASPLSALGRWAVPSGGAIPPAGLLRLGAPAHAANRSGRMCVSASAWVRRQQQRAGEFHPQPYRHLAKVLRSQGHYAGRPRGGDCRAVGDTRRQTGCRGCCGHPGAFALASAFRRCARRRRWWCCSPSALAASGGRGRRRMCCRSTTPRWQLEIAKSAVFAKRE